MAKNNTIFTIFSVATLMAGCSTEPEFSLSSTDGMIVPEAETPVEMETESSDENVEEAEETEQADTQEYGGEYDVEVMCSGNMISQKAAEEMLLLTELTDNETIYTTFDRIDGIASLFEACGDPWGLFPTTYRIITNRGLDAIEGGEFQNEQWGHDIIIDFASRYMKNLRAALQGDEPSWAWRHYYDLADNPDVSKTRTVLVAMIAHLMLDLPYSLADIDSQEQHKQDFFVFGELMIEVSDDLIADLRTYHNCDAEAILNGFFLGEWIDSAFGYQTTITLSYQTVRTKSWNNRWYIQQSWGNWVASSEIWSSFWATDGALAVLDASGAI